MLNSYGFDLWANEYDKSVNLSKENDDYPFSGYKKVLNFIYNQIRNRKFAEVLDIGFGTGVLTAKIYKDGYKIAGIDFSEKMISIAKEKMPTAKLVKWDFSNGLPPEIETIKFDFIISTYAIHHLTEKGKIDFIQSLSSYLNEGGKILIGDVSFETTYDLECCKTKYSSIWDYDEYYFVFSEMKKSMPNTLACDYTKISNCAGVLCVMKN